MFTLPVAAKQMEMLIPIKIVPAALGKPPLQLAKGRVEVNQGVGE